MEVAACKLVDRVVRLLAVEIIRLEEALKNTFRWTESGPDVEGLSPMKSDALTNPIVGHRHRSLQNGF